MSEEAKDERYNSLFTDTVERLKKLGMSDAEIMSIDTDFMFIQAGIVGNFANDKKPTDQKLFEEYYIGQKKTQQQATQKYISLLKQCYPIEYYGSNYEGSKWIIEDYKGIYDEKFLDKSKWKHVPSWQEFSQQKQFDNKLYRNPITDELTDEGHAIEDNKYQQYLQDIWPEYWTGKIFSNKLPVNDDNVKNNLNLLCEYTRRQILDDMKYAPAKLVMTDGHYKALIMGVPVEEVMKPEFDATIWNTDLSLTNLPTFLINHANAILKKPPVPHNLTEAENEIQKVIDTFNKNMNFDLGLAGMIKKALRDASGVIVINIVWSQLKDSIDKESLEAGNGVDTKQMSKDALTVYLKSFSENAQKMKEQALKDVNSRIDEISQLAVGVWDNIKSIPKTTSSMISVAALPQTIPTTGGITNPVTAILDVINIIDSILALFPPIINDILKILILMKTFVIAIPAVLEPLKAILLSISAIMSALKSKKNKSMTPKEIHKAIEKANKQIDKLTKKQEKLDKENDKEKSDWEDLEQTIKDLQDNITQLEEMCSCEQHSGTQQIETETEFDFNKELQTLNDFVTEIEGAEITTEESVSQLVINLDNKIPTITSGKGQSGNIPVNGETNSSASVVASPLQETNITPYCGKVFANV